MSEQDPIIVRKYGNRRLYRMDESRYVTLDELAELVREDSHFLVEDAKTGADLTGMVLAQVILEEEKRGTGGALPHELLRQLVRARDERLITFVVEHLPRLMEIYLEAADATAESLDLATREPDEMSAGEAAIIAQLAAVHTQMARILDSFEVEED